jgi:hypothetical protein
MNTKRIAFSFFIFVTCGFMHLDAYAQKGVFVNPSSVTGGIVNTIGEFLGIVEDAAPLGGGEGVLLIVPGGGTLSPACQKLSGRALNKIKSGSGDWLIKCGKDLEKGYNQVGYSLGLEPDPDSAPPPPAPLTGACSSYYDADAKQCAAGSCACPKGYTGVCGLNCECGCSADIGDGGGSTGNPDNGGGDDGTEEPGDTGDTFDPGGGGGDGDGSGQSPEDTATPGTDPATTPDCTDSAGHPLEPQAGGLAPACGDDSGAYCLCIYENANGGAAISGKNCNLDCACPPCDPGGQPLVSLGTYNYPWN